MRIVFLSFFSLFFFYTKSDAQSTVPAHLFHIQYAGATGNKEITSKTKYINELGFSYSHQLKSITFGLEYEFLFGYYRGKDLFSSLRTSAGKIISNNGDLIDIESFFRGNQIHVLAGKMFPKKQNSCFQANLGIGILQHYVKSVTIDGKLAYLSNENLKGYDQLSVGPSLKQQIRWNRFGPKQKVNFYLELFAQEAFMKNLRKYNYFTSMPDEQYHFNFIFGFQIGWLIPMFNNSDKVF